MRNVGVSSDLYGSLTKAAAREGITVNELAAEILHAVVGHGQPPPRESALTLQAQILTVLLKDKGELDAFALAQATGLEHEDRGTDQARYAAEALCKRGLLVKRRTEAKHTLYRLRP